MSAADPSESNSDAVRRARQGDAAALDGLISRHHDRLLRMARSRLGGALKAKLRASDLLQSSLLEVVSHFDQFRGGGDAEFIAWAGTIMDRTLTDRARFFGASKRNKETSKPPSSGAAAVPGPSAASHADVKEELELMQRVLGTLPPDFQQVIALCVDQGLSHKEAAQKLGRTEGATRVLLCRARAALVLKLDAHKKSGE